MGDCYILRMLSAIALAVSILFLAYGVYVVVSRGFTAVSRPFVALCGLTFSWQFTWSVLFQVSDAQMAEQVSRAGYLLILFLPTALYWFVVELTRSDHARRWIYLSVVVSACLGLALLVSDAIVEGVYDTGYGYYPHAGDWHWLHLVQTAVLVTHALLMLTRSLYKAVSIERLRLRYCLASVLIYVFAAVDYACNYGLDIMPPGVLFVALSLGIIAQAIARHDLLANPMMLAATIAHEIRTPLATIRNQARILERGLPTLVAHYESAHAGNRPGGITPAQLDYLRGLGRQIEQEVCRSNLIADLVLASSHGEIDVRGFQMVALGACVDDVLDRFPFNSGQRAKVRVRACADVHFLGSHDLMVFLLYNLLKNALSATAANGGSIEIEYGTRGSISYLSVSDTGQGIAPHVLPHVFEPYFTTGSAGAGMGLPFCRRVAHAFGGDIQCRSQPGGYTVFTVELPADETAHFPPKKTKSPVTTGL
jgi:two-component system, CAI-1 autoinducer sensor kinase/phosphatase CqsS